MNRSTVQGAARLRFGPPALRFAGREELVRAEVDGRVGPLAASVGETGGRSGASHDPTNGKQDDEGRGEGRYRYR